jgi:preprotein translocase subunit SecD
MRAGLIAGLVGLALVTLYMVAYYRVLGLVAMGSLAVSAALLWAIICWLGETRDLALTLAGITGIIVSIGVAVDSNVVFYENFREEVWRGRSARVVATQSFNTSFRTIVTANMASLIGAVLLYVLTVGSVRGFALFLAIGTVLDMIASYWFMRPLVLYLARHRTLSERPELLGIATAGGAQP